MASVPTKTDEKAKKNEQLATAILKEKHKPNRLMVEHSAKDDNSIVGLSQVYSLRKVPGRRFPTSGDKN